MTLLRIVFGLAIAAIGVMSILLTILCLIFLIEAPGGATLAIFLVAAVATSIIIVGVIFSFRKVMGPTPSDDAE
jgi:hypothetical protein